MWIVKIALERPYTFIVMALVILILSPIVIMRTPTDIFPNINIPVIAAAFNYTGLNAEEMEQRIVSIYERSLTTTVNDIEHIESDSINGRAIVRIFFQPTVNISSAVAQVVAVSTSIVRQLPEGAQPPFVLTYNASSVPILQLGLSGEGLSEQQLNDFAVNFIRTRLVTVNGAAIPYPYGGKQRQVMVDLNPTQMQSKGLSPVDVVNAIGSQNLILPAGTSKIGQFEYDVDLNGSPRAVEMFNDFPIKVVNGSTIYIRDVGHVRDGFSPQTNIVRQDGRRGALLNVLKAGNVSTLDVVDGIKKLLPRVQATLPPELKVQPLADQSIFVRASINGVIREAILAACLTGLMILLFLGSWRSTLIIAVSIPLSILTSVMVLSALHETINIMTLGGLALAVGILVDDATVTIENIERYLEDGHNLHVSILEGAAQIAVPAFVSTVCICIVFIPMFFLSGVPKYLFVPLAEAVVFAMLASYVLSRTLVPTLAMYLLKAKRHGGRTFNPFVIFQRAFDRGFNRLRDSYEGLLGSLLRWRAIFVPVFLLLCVAAFALYPWLGRDLFPSIDAGQFKLHMRTKTGTRIEETARTVDLVEQSIHRHIPGKDLQGVLDVVGLPYSSINTIYSNSAPVGTADADIFVSLTPEHQPSDLYRRALRTSLPREFPGTTFYFLPADIVSQILNFGLPAPIDVQIIGKDAESNRALASRMLEQFRRVRGISDLRIQQTFDQPKLHIITDRTKAADSGYTQRDVASSLLISLSGSFQTQPTFWLSPAGVSYSVVTETPQYDVQSLQDLKNIPLTARRAAIPETLNDLASISRGSGMAVVDHYDIQRVVDIFGAVDGRDLGGVGEDIAKIVDANRKNLVRGSEMVIRGQVDTMRTSFAGLLSGLAFSILLVYLVIVVNFQSWLDPFIIITALPGALAGIVLCLFLTRTTLSVPALMGAIMCMGVATANSILVISFAKERLAHEGNALEAALAAGVTRLRPVLMTALAMIIGMIPMALGMGEGGEQNAPLGRAVIGGLLVATVATLTFVPAVFSMVHGGNRRRAPQS